MTIHMTQKELNEKLFDTVRNNNINRVKEAMSLGADINSIDNDGWTVLMNACWRENINIARLLLEHGTKTDLKDEDGETALMKAVWYGNIDIVKLLIEYNADINMTDKHGDTALMKAAWYGNIEIAKLLIEHGTDISLKDKDGKTALDILKNNFPQQYKKWTEKTIIKSKQKKLRKEDSQAKQSTVPDYNI